MQQFNVHPTEDNVWVVNSADIVIPDGIHALFFEFKGEGGISLGSFTLAD